ncbi:SAM-dependent methyltransferase [Streptomyces sp. MAR4 CNX-425]|uniref:SAM-dependent methyltransferase n=1 Tax=Streptomyces sp. MAR4 CNX-425 TaxID=3406343 RepID=UPI003B5112BA
MTTPVSPDDVDRRAGKPMAGPLSVAKIATSSEMPVLLMLSRRLITPVYRAAFLVAASSSGMLGWLAKRPCDLETLADKLGIDDTGPLRVWLDIGVRLSVLDFRDGCYRLRSRSAKLLARVRHDASAAALEEVLRYHVPALLNAPEMLREGRRFSLSDQDGTVIARSTRVVEPFVHMALDRVVPRSGPVRLLEVGCGSGVHVRHAASLNPHLTALAIDMQTDVVKHAMENMAEWGLEDRVEVRESDLRTLESGARFDLITLHNSIYYFAEEERVQALARARGLLTPGGRLVLTTACQGGHVSLDMLNLWLECADFGGPLPHERDLVDQLREAGFAEVTASQVIPGEQFRAFVGTNERAPARA